MTEAQRESLNKRLFIFGAGGFGREVAWLATSVGYRPKHLTFLVEQGHDTPPAVDDIPVRVLGESEFPSDVSCVVAVGAPGARRHAVEVCAGLGLRFTRLVHPGTQMSSRVEIGDGAVVCAGNILTTNVVLGHHVHVNLSCTIGHDARLGDFTTIAPGANISGNVRIERDVYVGTGASIINGKADEPLTIGAGAVVAAGACVTRSVEPGAMVAGVPAVRKR